MKHRQIFGQNTKRHTQDTSNIIATEYLPEVGTMYFFVTLKPQDTPQLNTQYILHSLPDWRKK